MIILNEEFIMHRMSPSSPIFLCILPKSHQILSYFWPYFTLGLKIALQIYRNIVYYILLVSFQAICNCTLYQTCKSNGGQKISKCIYLNQTIDTYSPLICDECDPSPNCSDSLYLYLSIYYI